MVALGFLELGPWLEALAVAEERAVAVDLEVFGELAQAEHLSLVPVVIWPIAE